MKVDKSLYLQLGTDKALKLSEIVATTVNSMSQLRSLLQHHVMIAERQQAG